MEKISRILPANARTKSVDLKGSHPIRPGVPAFGRPEGTTASMRDRISFSQQARDLLDQQSPLKRPSELSKTALAKKISDDFFTHRIQPVGSDEVSSSSGAVSDAGFELAPEVDLSPVEENSLSQAPDLSETINPVGSDFESLSPQASLPE